MNANWNESEIIKKIRQRCVDRLTLVGEFVAGEAKTRCPVDLGNLRESIHYKVEENDLSVSIGTPVEYAPWVELGTGEYAEDGNGRQGGWFYTDSKGNGHFTLGNKPQPFLRPALIENKTEIKKLLGVE